MIEYDGYLKRYDDEFFLHKIILYEITFLTKTKEEHQLLACFDKPKGISNNQK